MNAFAFFDVDDTVITVKSMMSFQDLWYRETGEQDLRRIYEAEIRLLRARDVCWELLHRRFYAHFAGREVARVAACAAAWFAAADGPGLYHPAVVARLRRHQEQGEEPVFVSGSFPALLEPIARRLGVRIILATSLEVADGRYTGRVLPPQTIGAGKVEAIATLLHRTGVAAERCHAYGDDISDAPMLNAVGHPTVVRGGRRLEDYGKQRGWPVLDPAIAA